MQRTNQSGTTLNPMRASSSCL